MADWVRKGDRVVVITGNDRGRTGTVLQRKNDTVVVQGINIRKKHVKRRSQVQTPSIIEIEKSIHVSNVAPCDDEGTPVSLKVRQTNQEKELIYLKDGQEVCFRILRKN